MLGIGALGELDLGEIPAGVKPTPGGGLITTWTLDPNTLLGNPTNAVALAREVPLGAGLQIVNGTLVTSAPPVGSAGQIQFNSGSGTLGADANLYWDNTNKRLGIGTSAPSATLSVNPTAGTSSGITQGINITQTGAPFNTGRNWFAYNEILITGDQVSGTPPQLYTNGLYINMQEGDNSSASKAGLYVDFDHTTSSNAGAATGDRLGAVFECTASASAGGTDTVNGAQGTLFACGPVVIGFSGATNFFSMSGAEVDVFIQAGATTKHRLGWSVVGGYGNGASRAPGLDCAFEIADVSDTGWQIGLAFSDLHGPQPISTTGTMIGTYGGSYSAFAGVDFHNWSLQWFLIGPGSSFSVDGNGNMNVQNMTTQNINAANHTITYGNLVQSSDRRLKDKITESKYGLIDLLKIKVHDAALLGEDVKKPTIIAQELELIMPELVSTAFDDKLGINYPALIPTLIKSIQQLVDIMGAERVMRWLEDNSGKAS